MLPLITIDMLILGWILILMQVFDHFTATLGLPNHISIQDEVPKDKGLLDRLSDKICF